MTEDLKVLREYRPFPRGGLIRIVELPKEPLLSPEWARACRLRTLRATTEAAILAERKLAREWAGAAGGDRWEFNRYKRTGYRAE